MKNIYAASTKMFSKFGENLVFYELSKEGWNMFVPYMDEYIDVIAIKYICSNCGKLWFKRTNAEKNTSDEVKIYNFDPSRNYINFLGKKEGLKLKDYNNKITTFKICKNKECSKYNAKIETLKWTCETCTKILSGIPFFKDEKGIWREVKTEDPVCECGCVNFEKKVKLIQIKSSREEKNKSNTYAINLKLKDLFFASKEADYFFIFFTLSIKGEHSFFIFSEKMFSEKFNTKGVSYLKNQPREHFKLNKIEKWKDKWDLLE